MLRLANQGNHFLNIKLDLNKIFLAETGEHFFLKAFTPKITLNAISSWNDSFYLYTYIDS